MARGEINEQRGKPGNSALRSRAPVIAGIGLWACWDPALAQRAADNAITAAEDAFGTSTGYQQIGLYSMKEARGFNPQQAGNVRLEGLYFDLPGDYVTHCLVRSTTMRIGPAAQSYDFPAPSGIADLGLSTPDGRTGGSVMAGVATIAGRELLVEGRSALGQNLAGGACITYGQRFEPDMAWQSSNIGTAAVLRWTPAAHLEIRPFVSVDWGGQHALVPTVYTDGFQPPPLYTPRSLGAQGWTNTGWHTTLAGGILNWAPEPQWSMSAGLFLALERDPVNFTDEYLSVLPDRTADHTLDVVPRLDTRSTSGQWRASRLFGAGNHTRIFELTMRGRSSNRDYGGDALVDYGRRSLDVPLSGDPVPFQTLPTSRDRVRQLDVGSVYEERWAGRGSLSLGMLRAHYRRELDAPGLPGVAETFTPWLPSVRARLELSSRWSAYGSYIQGLEDSALAPSTAVNHGEAPPATRSRQVDAGVRAALTRDAALLVGGFQIDKPYFNLNGANTYTQLGALRYRGLESSFNFSVAGTTVVAGAVWLRPHVTRTIPEPGATGTQPLGPVPLHLNLNVDVAPPALQPWAAGLQLNRLSGAVATSDDAWRLPAILTDDANLRYATHLRGAETSLRLDGSNLAGARALHVSSVGLVSPEPSRRVMLTLTVDE